MTPWSGEGPAYSGRGVRFPPGRPGAVWPRETTMGWDENPDLTEPSDDDFDRPLMGVTGGGKARAGDTYVLTFEDDGEEVDVETDGGGTATRAVFDATLEDVSFPADSNGDRLEAGDEVRFMTGSKRFLAKLKEHAPVGGKTIKVYVVDTGFDAEYDLEVADGE